MRMVLSKLSARLYTSFSKMNGKLFDFSLKGTDTLKKFLKTQLSSNVEYHNCTNFKELEFYAILRMNTR